LFALAAADLIAPQNGSLCGHDLLDSRFYVTDSAVYFLS